MSNKIKPKQKKKLAEFLPNSLSVFLFAVGANFLKARVARDSSPHPSSRAARADSPSEARRHLSSKYFRTTFRVSHQQEFCKFSQANGLVASRLRRSAGACPARRDAAKSHGSPNETETFIRV